LLKYELILLIAQPVPGALGLVLRRTMYRWLLGSLRPQRRVRTERHAPSPPQNHVGDDVVIDDQCLLDAKGRQSRHPDWQRRLHRANTILSCKNGDITLDDGANVGSTAKFLGRRCAVGKDTLLAPMPTWLAGIMTFSDRSLAVTDQPRQGRGIVVGAGAWIGAGATVLGRRDGRATVPSSERARSSARRSRPARRPSASRALGGERRAHLGMARSPSSPLRPPE